MAKDKLIFHYLQDERRYELRTKSGELVSDLVAKFIKQHDKDFPLITEEDYKTLKGHRTEINGLLDEIETARKQTTAVVVNPLLNACKPLEKELKEVSARLKEKLDAFKPKEEKPKTTTIITIEYPIGSEEIKKVKTYLKRVKIAFKEEEK